MKTCPGARRQPTQSIVSPQIAGAARTRGTTLVDLLVIMSIITPVLILAAILFHRLLQSEQIAARSALTEITTARLANQFRRDVHAARQIRQMKDAEENVHKMELLPESESSATVIYTAGPERILREVVGENVTSAREIYRLPRCSITFSNPDGSDGSSNPKFVAIVIDRPRATVTSSAQINAPPLQIVIDAELGRDGRLSGSNRPQKAQPGDSRKEPE